MAALTTTPRALPIIITIFFRELENEVNYLKDRFPVTEIVLSGDLNSRIANHALQFPYDVIAGETVNRSGYLNRSTRDLVLNNEGKK